MSKVFISVIFLLPLVAFAQSDDLRAQIRADLMRDPRTAQLSSVELDALVAAIADEAQVTGQAETYLDARTAPTFTYDPPPVSDESPWMLILSAPIMIALSAFVAGVVGLIVFAFQQRRRRNASIPTAA